MVLALACLCMGFALASSGQSDVETLISQLRDVGKPGAGYGAELPYGSGGFQFLPQPDIDRFRDRIWKVWKPEVAPALVKLIKIGLPALPALLRHLNDITPTKVIVPLKYPTWIGTERDPRNRSPYGQRVHDAMPNDFGIFDHYGDNNADSKTYSVRVGDLCYIAVGQIVGRDLEVISVNPRESRLTSPVRNPELATDVAGEWGNLSAAGHIRTLEYDVLHSRMPFLAIQPFKRLRFYYPQEAARFAQTLLNRQIAYINGTSSIGSYLMSIYNPDPFESVVSAPHDELWMQVSAVDLAGWLMRSLNPEITRRALRVKKRLFPKLDELHTPPVDATDVGDVLEIVEETGDLPSKSLDNTIDDAFRRALKLPFTGYIDNGVLDDLAIACAKRLASKGYIEPYRAYLHKRAAQAKPEPGYSTVPYRPDLLRHWANVLDRYGRSVER